MVADVLAVVEAAGAGSIVLIAQGHGGWVAVELLRRLGERVSKLVLISWNPVITSTNPAAAPILPAGQGLQSDALRGALQDEAGWKDAADALVDTWVNDAPPPSRPRFAMRPELTGSRIGRAPDARSRPCSAARETPCSR